jgi:tetratricopeptide (TPR) repeat protein
MRLSIIINLLIWVGLSASHHLWPGVVPVQASANECSAAQSAQESDLLELGKPIQREISGGQTHSYKITMSSGQYLHVVVAQRGIDVAVALFAPDGKKISEADSEHLIKGSESLSAITEAPGAYLIEARSPEKTARTGRYEIKVEELRTAAAKDKYRVAGESVFREAEQLKDGTLEAKRKSIKKYHEALELYRRATDRRGEAITLNSIGEVYRSRGEMQMALEKYSEALPISRAISARKVEANILNNIGVVYWSLGEMQMALEKYNEALPISRAMGDRNGEAATLLGIARVEQKRGNLTQARQLIEQAIGLVESLRTNIAGQELRASYFASRQEFFETYIDVLMQMHEQNQAAAFDAVALAVSERARARSLLELLTEARADIRQGVDGSLLKRERSLQQRLNARAAEQARLITRKHTPEQAAAAAKEIAAITAEYEEIQAQIRARSPRYAALTQPQPLGLTEIQQQVLDPDTLLLEY